MENNGYAVHSSLDERQSYNIIEHVSVYGIETHVIEAGYDFVEVAKKMAQIYQSVKENPRPLFIEIKTCRYKEHVGPGDDFCGGYRTEEQVQKWQAKDPLIIDEESVKEFMPSCLAEIEQSVDFAENSAFPGQEDLLSDVV